MVDDVVVNKAASIERCLARVLEEYRGHETEIEADQTRQDALVLNLLRACETAIDLAMHLVRVRRLGIPQSSRDAFDLLVSAGVMESSIGDRMKRMVGFRNVAVHAYRELDLSILRHIVEERLDDFRAYTETLLRQAEQ